MESLFSPVDEKLFAGRIVQVSGPVDSKLAYKINKILLAMEMDSASKPIFMYINSPGGEVTSGFAIFDTARFIKPRIVTIVNGLAASMGSIIALSAERKYRFATPNSKFLIHQPSIHGMMQGSASDLEIHAKDIIRTKERINRLYAEETGKPYEIVADATERDRWLDVQEGLDFGLIHRVIQNRNEIEV